MSLDPLIARHLAQVGGGAAIAHQLLIYPALDDRLATPSCGEFAEGYSLTTDVMRFCWSTYLDGAADANPAWAAPLRAASVDAACIRLEGMIHGCIHMLGLTPAARQLFDAAGEGLRHLSGGVGEQA